MARRHKRAAWIAFTGDTAPIGHLMRQLGFAGSDSDPTSVRGSFHADGRPRRVHARYANGWTCSLHLPADGPVTLIQSMRSRLTGRMPA